MKLLVFTAWWIFPLAVCAQEDEYNLKNPGDYNNFIMKEVTATVQKNFEYISFSVHSEEYDKLESKRIEVLQQIEKTKENIRTMPPLQGDTRLRDEAVDVMNEYQRAFSMDYKSIIGLKKKSRDSYESMQAYFEAEDKAEERVNKATQQLRKAQRAYAEKNNVPIADSHKDAELQVKMGRVVAVNNYWRTVFLNYFKVSGPYDKMWNAMAEKKANVIERERLHTLVKIDEVLPVLKKLPDFNGDTEFRDQTINIVEYFQSVSSVKFKRIVELLGKKKLEQADVDEVNGIIHQSNSDHERLFYNWNIASQDLFRKNVEKE